MLSALMVVGVDVDLVAAEAAIERTARVATAGRHAEEGIVSSEWLSALVVTMRLRFDRQLNMLPIAVMLEVGREVTALVTPSNASTY